MYVISYYKRNNAKTIELNNNVPLNTVPKAQQTVPGLKRFTKCLML